MRTLLLVVALGLASNAWAESPVAPDRDRSPVDVALDPAGKWLATANQTSDSVSLVRLGDGQVLHEVAVARRPEMIVNLGDDELLVSSSYGGALTRLAVRGDRLELVGEVRLGMEPVGIAVSEDRRTAFVALSAAAQVAEIDLEQSEVRAKIDVGQWPRFLALSPDGRRMVVGTSGDRGVTVVDVEARRLVQLDQFVGLNIGHMQASRDGRHAYYPWMVYRRNTTDAGNIRKGWVLASRIGRSRFDGETRREAFSLDPPGKAVADPFGLRLTSDERWLVVSAPGTHELLVYRNEELPFLDVGGTDHIEPALLKDAERFYRVPVEGRPMGLRIAADDATVYVANYLTNGVDIVDLRRRERVGELRLGGPEAPSLARRGEAIFYDGRRSLDQWYSCHSCHQDGGTNSVMVDTLNDGSARTFKTILPLYNVAQSGPWTWHGWQQDLGAAMRKSLTSTMVGPEPPEDDVLALLAYMGSLETPPNPFAEELAHDPTTPRASAVARGREVFFGAKAACAQCHKGPLFADGENHDVGISGPGDRYRESNTPSLLGVHRRVKLLHDGRATSLEEALQGDHAPERVAGEALTDSERADLIAFLRTL